MNKFIHDPDNLGSLVGCAFWLVLLAGLMALMFGTLHGLLAGAGR